MTGNDAREVLSTTGWHTVGPHQVPSWPLFTVYQAPTTGQMALEGKRVTFKPLSRWEGGGKAEKAWPALLGFCGRDSAETCSHHKCRAKAPQSNTAAFSLPPNSLPLVAPPIGSSQGPINGAVCKPELNSSRPPLRSPKYIVSDVLGSSICSLVFVLVWGVMSLFLDRCGILGRTQNDLIFP